MERIGMRSLDDELEFYELVELDAEGEDDQTFDMMNRSTNHKAASIYHVVGKSMSIEQLLSWRLVGFGR
jgi:hypothetical protein